MRFLLMLAFLPAVAFGVTVGFLPLFEYVDSKRESKWCAKLPNENAPNYLIETRQIT